MRTLTSVGMFSGAGGLDLGFELGGFAHQAAMDIDSTCVATLRRNRPEWNVAEADARDWTWDDEVDVVVAGPPCQGYSLGGHRSSVDDRNLLYREVLRTAHRSNARVVAIENVLNLRTMVHPETGRRFHEQIAAEFVAHGYEVHYGIMRMDEFGVPQTRRRFVFVGFRDGAPVGYRLPSPSGNATIRSWVHELGQREVQTLPNHSPAWNFRSSVHTATGDAFGEDEEAVVVRFSRTASDGNPLRSFDAAIPAVDTGTLWGWAQGNVRAARFQEGSQ